MSKTETIARPMSRVVMVPDRTYTAFGAVPVRPVSVAAEPWDTLVGEQK